MPFPWTFEGQSTGQVVEFGGAVIIKLPSGFTLISSFPDRMSGAITLSAHSPFPFSSSKPLKSLKPTSIPAFSTSNLALSAGFSSTKCVSCKNRVRRRPPTMTELVATSAFRGDNGGEGPTTIEGESLIAGPSEFSAVLSAGGLEATLNSLSKWLVAALFGVVILWRHDAESLWVAMGSVLNTMLSLALKRILNQERPASALKSGPGMPSSHAQSIFFTVVFAILSMVECLGINGLTVMMSVLALAIGSYFSWLRVSQQFHTISQVVVGSAVGSVYCILWFLSWKGFVLNAYNSRVWVRVLVILGAVGFCLGFVVHVIKHWFRDER